MSNKIYLSLATIPGREKSLKNVILSLINQTIKPNKIFLNKCKFYKRITKKYNKTLLKKITYGPVKINECSDYGPITKLFGFLDNIKNYGENDYVILVDDDLFYKKFLVEEFSKMIKKDNKSCFSFCVDKINNINCGKGADGFCLKIKYLKKIKEFYQILIKDNPLWFYHDDYIISCYLHTLGVSLVDMRNHSKYKISYDLSPHFRNNALHLLEGERSTENLGKVLSQSYNKLKKNNKFINIKKLKI